MFVIFGFDDYKIINNLFGIGHQEGNYKNKWNYIIILIMVLAKLLKQNDELGIQRQSYSLADFTIGNSVKSGEAKLIKK
jgi:hypothetical protein